MSWRNLTDRDRAWRIVLGAVLLALGFSGAVDGLTGIAFVIFGWLPLATGITGWCPLYSLLGIQTRAE